jgi:hypothetical protein
MNQSFLPQECVFRRDLGRIQERTRGQLSTFQNGPEPEPRPKPDS